MNDQERILEARRKLAEKFGNQSTKLGGKGTQKRKLKVVHKSSSSTDDKKIKGLIKKLNAQPLPDIQEVNMFTSENTVIQFKNPEVSGSFQNQTLIVSGNSETKNIKDCLADVISQMSKEQIEKLQKDNILTGSLKTDKKDEEIPELVNFDDSSKK